MTLQPLSLQLSLTAHSESFYSWRPRIERLRSSQSLHSDYQKVRLLRIAMTGLVLLSSSGGAHHNIRFLSCVWLRR